MTRAAPVLPQPGDARSATVVAAALQTIVTPSVNVDGPSNLAEEGMDERSVSRTSVHEVVTPKVSTTPTVLNNVAYATLVMGATTFQTGGFVVPAGAVAHVVADLSCETDGVAQAGIMAAGGSRYVTMRLRYSIGGVPQTATGSESWVGSADSFVAENEYGCMDTVYQLAAGTYDWVELQTVLSGAGTYRVASAGLYVTIYKKAV
jgi:hypothetical protein